MANKRIADLIAATTLEDADLIEISQGGVSKKAAISLSERKANKGEANGYAPLDADSKVPAENIGGTGADNTKFLRGDRTWQVPVDLVQPGSIVAYGGTSAPTGYLMCQGAEVSRTTYAGLFAIIGIAYGAGNGSTTFKLPDLQQRFPLGKAADGTGATLGGTGGEIDHTHTGPSHAHTGPSHTHTGPSHTHTGPSHTHTTPALNHDAGDAFGGAGQVYANHAAGTTGAGGTGATGADGTGATGAGGTGATGAEGTGATGANNAPFQAVNYIIKV